MPEVKVYTDRLVKLAYTYSEEMKSHSISGEIHGEDYVARYDERAEFVYITEDGFKEESISVEELRALMTLGIQAGITPYELT